MVTTVAPEDVLQLWVDFKADMSNQELRNRLVELYFPLVKYNGERIWARLPEGVELDDLISAGVFGLMDAIDAFDLSRGVKFETYCVPRIRGAMLDELRTMDWVPRLVRSKASKLNEAMKNTEARLGRQPTEIELAAELNITVPELDKMILDANAVNLISLNKKWYETDSYKDVREIDILEDKKGEEQIFIHAAENMDTRVGNDRFETVGNDSHLHVEMNKFEHVDNNRNETVDADHKEEIGKDRHLKVEGKEAKEVGASLSLTVKGDVAEVFKANHSEQTTKDYYLKAQNVVIEGMQNITLSVGGSHIAIEPTQIEIKAGAQLKLEGVQVEVKGSAQTSVQGGAMTEIKGGIVKIN